jgi:hypothetical protein
MMNERDLFLYFNIQRDRLKIGVHIKIYSYNMEIIVKLFLLFTDYIIIILN